MTESQCRHVHRYELPLAAASAMRDRANSRFLAKLWRLTLGGSARLF